MAYVKTIWNNGATPLSAENMNHIEEGIAALETDTQADLSALDARKVEKVTGKDLSTNDYTTAEKNKLAGIQDGAQVNPGNATTSAAGLMSASDKIKLTALPSIVTGTFVLRSEEPTTLITFSDSGLIGKRYIICGAQDSGNPPLRASLTSSTGAVKVYLADPVTIMRVNYIAW